MTQDQHLSRIKHLRADRRQALHALAEACHRINAAEFDTRFGAADQVILFDGVGAAFVRAQAAHDALFAATGEARDAGVPVRMLLHADIAVVRP